MDLSSFDKIRNADVVLVDQEHVKILEAVSWVTELMLGQLE